MEKYCTIDFQQMIKMQMLCKEIGDFFGEYEEEDGRISVDTGDNVYEYSGYSEMLADWVDTLIEAQKTGGGIWEEEILFIFFDVMKKKPKGVRKVQGKRTAKWKAYVDICNSDFPHGKNLHLGSYDTIAEAICARRDFLSEDIAEIDTSTSFGMEKAKEKAKERCMRAKERRG